MSRFLITAIASAVLLQVWGCATESSRSVEVAKVESAATPFRGTRVPISVGKFDNRSGFMRGIFTDGDLRRALEKGIDFAAVTVDEVMTRSPRTLAADALAVEAVQLMEAHKINQLLVVDERGALLGALNMHDLFRAKVI